jgi:hypothetical protein
LALRDIIFLHLRRSDDNDFWDMWQWNNY